jgi:hypothetical protein
VWYLWEKGSAIDMKGRGEMYFVCAEIPLYTDAPLACIVVPARHDAPYERSPSTPKP